MEAHLQVSMPIAMEGATLGGMMCACSLKWAPKTRTISSRRRCFNESNIFKYAKIFSLDFERTDVTNYFATGLNFLPIWNSDLPSMFQMDIYQLETLIFWQRDQVFCWPISDVWMWTTWNTALQRPWHRLWNLETCKLLLVGGIPTPLKNMSSSVGMKKFPI